MGRIFFTRTGIQLQCLDGGLNWDGTVRESFENEIVEIVPMVPYSDTSYYDVAGGQWELDQIEAFERLMSSRGE